MKIFNVGIIGCGNITPAYCKSLPKFPHLKVAACADLDVARAQARAKEFNVAKACTPDELLADPTIDLVLNLTIPKVHAAVGMQAVAKGKHHYSEKPFGLDRVEGKKLIDAAKAKKVRLGCAPDTVLGGGIQTCRKLIDDGAIGAPVAATAFMFSHGPEGWHPDPEFFYKAGGGPMFDMGPYYLTALITLMGPIKRVTGSTRATFPERTIGSGAKAGQKITVDIQTHVAGMLEFANGAIATIITSFDVWNHHLPNIEIHGSESSLQVPDPNTFGGKPLLYDRAEKKWNEVALTHGYAEQFRGLGVADMAQAIIENRPHRMTGELAFHVLDIMQSIHESPASGRHIELTTTCVQPAAMPVGLAVGKVG